MFGLIFGGIASFFSAIALWLLLIAAIVTLIWIVIKRFFPRLSAFIPGFDLIGLVALGLTAILIVLRIAVFVTFLLGAQAKIDKLEAKNDKLEQDVKDKQNEINRKATQNTAVDTTDRQADIKYVPVYRTIEKLRTQMDLSLANQLALDLTTDFYKLDEVPDATTPSN